MEAIPREILLCHTDDARIPFLEWLFSLDVDTRARVRVRIDRVEDGNLGDWRPLGEGVCELKIDIGPGYRVYFGQKGREIHLISGGNKGTQVKDIASAKKIWRAHE